MYKLGELEIHRAIESEVPIFDTFTFFPDATREVVEANKDWLMPRYIDPKTIEVILCIQSYVIKTSHHTILVDTCVGNHKSRPARPSWHMQNSPFIEELASVGVHPEEVDFVLCTHLHVDHVGWNTLRVEENWEPTFSNADYLYSRREWEHWSTQPQEYGPVFEDSVQPIFDSGLAQLVPDDYRVTDEIWLEPTPGHTPGHVSVHIQSQGEEAVITGDMIHHPCQIKHVDWATSADVDQAQAVLTRQKFLEQYADRPVLIIGTHFAGPSAGKIVRDASTFRLDY